MNIKKIQKKSKNQLKRVQQKLQKSFRETFDSIINYKYNGLIIAAAYFLIMTFVSYNYHEVGDYGVETDFFWSYVPNAEAFQNGIIQIDQFRGPLYQITLGIFGYFFSEIFDAGIFINLLSAFLVVYLSFEILKKVFTSKIAFFAIFLLVFNQYFIQYTYSAGTDMFFNALVAASVFFFIKDKNLNYLNIILAAFIGGLVYLTRYNGVFILSFILIILFVNFYKVDWQKRIKVSLLFLFVFIVTITPWSLYILSEKGELFYNNNYKNLEFELYAKDKVDWDEFWFGYESKFTSVTDVILHDPGKFIENSVNNIGTHFVNDMDILLELYVGIFTIIGLLIFFLNKPWRKWNSRLTAYFFINLFFFSILLLVFYGERFSLFLIPFYTGMAIYGFWAQGKSLTNILPKFLSYLFIIVIIIVTAYNAYSYNKEVINSGPSELLVISERWEENKTNVNDSTRVVSRKPHVAYYLDMNFKVFPVADDYEELINELKKENIDYLFFSQVEALARPQFKFLLEYDIPAPGLETVVYCDCPRAVLYKVVR